MTRSEERRSSSQFNWKLGRFHPYASNDRVSQQPDRKSSFPAWKKIHERQQGKKGHGKPTSFSQKPAKGSKQRKLQLLCTECNWAERLCLCTRSRKFEPFTSDGETQGFDQQERVCIFTCKLLCCKCSFCHWVAQKKGVNPNFCQKYTEIKYVKDVSCVGHLSSANIVTNVPTVAINPPVGARLHQFREKWEALGSSPKVVTMLREGYILPFRFRPNLTRSPTVIRNYVNPQRQSHLLEALYQLTNKNAVEPLANQNSLRFYNRLFLVPKPNNQWRPILDLSTLNTFLNT